MRTDAIVKYQSAVAVLIAAIFPAAAEIFADGKPAACKMSDEQDSMPKAARCEVAGHTLVALMVGPLAASS